MGETSAGRDSPLDAAGVTAGLATLPGWSQAGGCIERRYKTSGWKATMMVVATIGHLCEAAWHHPELVVTYDGVLVRLSTHSAKGITARDFELAARLDAVIGWRPGTEGGALTGPPKSQAVIVDG